VAPKRSALGSLLRCGYGASKGWYMSTTFQKIAFIALIMLMFGVSTGVLGGL